MTSNALWTPSPEKISASNTRLFCDFVEKQHGTALGDYHALYQWSISQPDLFWGSVWDFCDIRGEEKGDRILVDPHKMPGAQWFPDARLNFAENLLRRRDDKPALIFRGEDQVDRSLSYRELYDSVAATAKALKAAGVGVGDRVAGYVPNMPEAIVAMLASASLGAVWSSSSPDFGVKGVLDRFGQIEPTVLFCADGYFYNGKRHDSLSNVAEFCASLPSLKAIVVVPYTLSEADTRSQVNDALSNIASCQAVTFSEFVSQDPGSVSEDSGFASENQGSPEEIEFAQLPFDHPLYIMFSSGTTGVPKCIVHGAGGTLLQHVKEHKLHVNLLPEDRIFFFTTCGWMMWNWLVGALAVEATVLLYDGSPFYPDGNTLFNFADESGMSILGTSAKFIDAANKAGIHPRRTHKLAALHTIMSTGSPLAPESYDYVYERIKSDVCLSSISGGTDIVSCFALGNATLPVYRGELQCLGLGMRVEVYDDQANAVVQQKGELVCTAPFPCMPIGFWNDEDGSRYHEAYFDRFDNVWCHGDYVEITEHGGMIIYGRSDAVLNPGGVRIGTAEIYRQVEQFDEVIEALVVGQDWKSDVRVVLFLRLRDGVMLDAALVEKIQQHIRRNTTPRHVPAIVLAVADIPRTKSGKIVELAVRNIIHQRPVRNRDALANPEALEHFADLPELQVAVSDS